MSVTNGRKREFPWINLLLSRAGRRAEQAGCAGASPLSALIDVALAVGALKAWWALAGVAVDVVGAGAPVPAWLTQTLVGVCLTFVPMEPRQADAREGVYPIHARGSVLAGIWDRSITVKC